jgi:hypothetical protein
MFVAGINDGRTVCGPVSGAWHQEKGKRRSIAFDSARCRIAIDCLVALPKYLKRTGFSHLPEFSRASGSKASDAAVGAV